MKALIIRHKQIGLFIIAGGMSAILEVGSFKYFSSAIPKIFPSELNLWGIHFPFSNTLSTGLGILSNYLFSIWFVFKRGRHSRKREFFLFLIISLITTLFSLALFQVFFSFVFLGNMKVLIMTFSPEILSKITAIILVSIINFSVKKKFIFNN